LEVKRDILWRVYLSFLGIAVLSVFIIGKAFYIQRFQGSYWKSMSDSLHQRIESLDAERGTIDTNDTQPLSELCRKSTHQPSPLRSRVAPLEHGCAYHGRP